MSKIGKKPIQIPTGITIDIKMPVVKVSGPKGELSFALPKEIELRLNDKELLVIPVGKSKKTPALWGTARAIIANMVAVRINYDWQEKLHCKFDFSSALDVLLGALKAKFQGMN